MIWVKVESWLLAWEEKPFEAQDAGSCFLKVWMDIFSLKEALIEGRLKIGFMESFELDSNLEVELSLLSKVVLTWSKEGLGEDLLIVELMLDNYFSSDEGCKVAKVFIGKKESNEEEEGE